MSVKPDNPNAFPVPDESPGMTLRDYFAASALIGMLANPAVSAQPDEDLAADVYNTADAMLAERSKTK